MADQVEWFYFTNYMRQWSDPAFARAMSKTPHAMTWDDHDIFDAWGCYPAKMQWCPVFQGLLFIARKFYALLQQHATPELIHESNQVFGEHGWNWLGCLGCSTAILMLDTRTERSREVVIRPGSWAMIQQRLAQLPTTIRHVVVVSPVPLVYPLVPVVESSLTFMTGRGRTTGAIVSMMQKTGLASHLYSAFGEPEVLDDHLDQWSSKKHIVEKLAAIELLQDMSKARGFRFSFLSGDAHLAGVGRFLSYPKSSLRTDAHFMPQIISSSIGNTPPTESVVKALTACARPKRLDETTQEMMVRGFEGNRMFKAARNWCLVEERQPLISGAAMAGSHGSLIFQLRFENPSNSLYRPEEVDVMVPVLEVAIGQRPLTQLRPFALLGPPPSLPPEYQQQMEAFIAQQQAAAQQQQQPQDQALLYQQAPGSHPPPHAGQLVPSAQLPLVMPPPQYPLPPQPYQYAAAMA